MDLLDGLDMVSMMMLRSNSVGHELAWKPGDSSEIRKTQKDLQKRIIELYTLIVKFQIEAACYLCHTAIYQKTRDTVRLDNWKAMCDGIVQSEKNCWDLINKINADRSKYRSDRQVRISPSGC
jgi:PP-loop superfamily ATP-utilizing enzyme